MSDVQHKWKNVSSPVEKYQDITMAQFALKDIRHRADDITSKENHGEKVVLNPVLAHMLVFQGCKNKVAKLIAEFNL